MPKMMLWVVLILLITTAADSEAAAADERATTNEIPATLKALGVDEDLIVSQREAHLIRGDSYYVHFPSETGFGILNFRAQGDGLLRLTIVSPRYVLRLRVGN